MSEPTLQAFPYDQIHANPYQHHGARRFRGPEFDALVESIRADGVQQYPKARPHPQLAGAVQLVSGHRRLAASRVARPDQPFTVVLESFGDLQMLEQCVVENIHRSDLNDIERAQMIESYKQLKPDATNADMARVFGLKDPASITNLRKLLKLPAPIQEHVAAGNLPDAYARQLVGVSAVNPKAALTIANKVAAAPRSEKQQTFDDNARELYWKKMVDLNEGGWSLDWLTDAPVEVERDLGDGDHFIGACAGCPFNVNAHCARRACFEEKYGMFAAAEVERVATAIKIAPARTEDKTFPIFKGEWQDDATARSLLNARAVVRAALRVAPHPVADINRNYLKRVLDSNVVTLVGADGELIKAYLAEQNSKRNGHSDRPAKVERAADESDAAKAKRIAAEKKEMAEKRAARSAMWKSYHDALWLLEHAAREIGEELSLTIVNPAFVECIEEEFCAAHDARMGAGEIEERIEKEIKAEPDKTIRDTLRLTRVALCVMSEEAINAYFKPDDYRREYEYERVRDEVLSTEESFGVILPAGWDIPPVHHTEFNCWHCGVFAGNMSEKLTQRDLNEDGWIDDGKAGVFCSQAHKDAYIVGLSKDAAAPAGARASSKKGKPNAKAASKKSKPKRK